MKKVMVAVLAICALLLSGLPVHAAGVYVLASSRMLYNYDMELNQETQIVQFPGGADMLLKHPDLNYLYSIGSTNNEIYVFDADSNTLLPPLVTQDLPVSGASNLCFSPGATKLYVLQRGAGYGASQIAVIDTVRTSSTFNQIIETFPIVSHPNLWAIAVSPDGEKLFVGAAYPLANGKYPIFVYDIECGAQLLQTLEVTGTIYGIHLNYEDGKGHGRLYVNTYNNGVYSIDPDTYELTHIALSSRAYLVKPGVFFLGGERYVPSETWNYRYSVIDTATDTLLSEPADTFFGCGICRLPASEVIGYGAQSNMPTPNIFKFEILHPGQFGLPNPEDNEHLHLRTRVYTGYCPMYIIAVP